MTDNHLAELERKAALADELVAILSAEAWSANERIVYAGVRRITADGRREAGWLIKQVPMWKLVKHIGLPARTCRDTLKKLKNAGEVDIEVERPKGSDYDAAITTVMVKEYLPKVFAPLPATENGKSARRRAVEYRARKNQLEAIVSELACPKCGVIGCLHVTIGAECSECKTVLTQEELEARLGVDVLEKVDLRGKLRAAKGKYTPAQARVSTPFDEGGTDYDDGITHVANFATPPKSNGIIEPLALMDDHVANFAARSERALPDISIYAACIATTEEAPSAGSVPSVLSASNLKPSRSASSNCTLDIPDLSSDEILTQADTLQWFAEQGGDRFTLAEHRGKAVKERDWPNNPHSLDEAYAHLAQGGNTGWAGSGELVLLDADFNAASFATTFAQRPPIVFRRDAWPERGKIVVRCSDPENLNSMKLKLSPEHKKPVFEVLAKGSQGIIAGIHQTGATICLWKGEIPTMSAAEIHAHCIAWLDETYPASEYPDATWRKQPMQREFKASPATVEVAAGEVDKLSYSTQVEQAIAWFNSDANNQSAAMNFAQQAFKGRGNYIALRPDDRTPSAFRFSDDAFIDYGEFAQGQGGRNGVTDCFELHCIAHPEKDKRRHCFEVVNQWRASLGAKQLPDARK